MKKRYKSDNPLWWEEWLDFLRYDMDWDPYCVLAVLAYKISKTGEYIAKHNTIVGAEKVKEETDEVAGLLTQCIKHGCDDTLSFPPQCLPGLTERKRKEWLKILSEDADYDYACILNVLIERLKRFRKATKRPADVAGQIKETEDRLKRVMEDEYFHKLTKKHPLPPIKFTIDEKGRRVSEHNEKDAAIIRPVVKAAREARIEDLRLALKSLCGIFKWSGARPNAKAQKSLERACKLILSRIFGWWD